MRKIAYFLAFLVSFMSVPNVAQQDDCSTIPEIAFNLTTELCADTGINQLCYGYASIEVEPQPGALNFSFEQPGDRVDVTDVLTLHSSPMDEEQSVWGVSLMRLQADIEGTMPGQAVTFLLFGENDLETVQSEDESNLRAFYVQTGIGDSRCAEAPNSGILISTPQGAGQINLVLNEVEIALGSTAYFQAEAGGEMSVSVLEGRAEVTADGETQAALMNMRVRVPLDENLAPAGPPSLPEACNLEEMQSLPSDWYVNCEEVWINLDNACPSRLYIPDGMRVNFSNGYGYDNLEEAQADYAEYSPTISLDGVVVVDEVGPIEEVVAGSWWVYGQQFFMGEPEPGDYVITGDGPHGSHMGRGATRMCEITVMEPVE